MLPSFLSASAQAQAGGRQAPPYSAVYKHSARLGNAHSHCLWWPARVKDEDIKTLLIFIPGNPGLCDFYQIFLSHINENGPDTMPILAHSLLGHSPLVDPVPLSHSGLRSQVEAIVEVIDDISSNINGDLKVILIGHSVGAWIASQVLKERADRIVCIQYLFPTLAHIARTPNGKQLSWLFRQPIARAIANLSRLARFLPNFILTRLFVEWPNDQVEVLRAFICSPTSVLSSLTLAHEEMVTIREFDSTMLTYGRKKLFFLFAEEDRWVGANKDTILQVIEGQSTSAVLTARHGIPHAYCINHGKEIGDVCIKRLLEK